MLFGIFSMTQAFMAYQQLAKLDANAIAIPKSVWEHYVTRVNIGFIAGLFFFALTAVLLLKRRSSL